jgi:hypothetical protein
MSEARVWENWMHGLKGIACEDDALGETTPLSGMRNDPD